MMSQKRSRREYEADLRKQEAPFVVYGTPLPPLDDNTRDDGSYVPVWKQEVTDDRGRKRLHGAFTGGFSAGYFNSVGSKEGWAPSTFVSSRSNRAKDAQNSRQQKAEDFMDEEDLREQEEARQISTTNDFAGFGTADDAGAQNVLDDLFRPTEDTMGEKLLNRMGWKKGQGIGPRVRRKIDPNDANSEVRDFPPEDSPMLDFSHKVDNRGLGFGDDTSLVSRPIAKSGVVSAVSQDDSEDDESRPGLSFMTRARPKPRLKSTQVTGMSIASLNGRDSDEEDPYEMGPKVSYNRIIGGDKKNNKIRATALSNANPLLKTKPVFISKSKQLPSSLKSLRKCHDGRLPLTGFVLADELDDFSSMILTDDKYKPPDVPEGWQPAKLGQAASGQNQAEQTNPAVMTAQTAESRRRALGESPLPSKSVFDFLSPIARDHLATASGNTNLPQAGGEAPPTSTSSNTSKTANSASSLKVPHLDITTAQMALSRLKKDKSPPYADDLVKQGRYRDFLRYSVDTQPAAQRIPPLRAPQHKFSDNEHLAELAEFAQTAQLFKPATGFLASRFTSAVSSTGPSDVNGCPDNETGEEELLRKAHEKPKDPAEEAAKMGMFGIATRSVKSWQPTRLVCKRFGVDMPVSWNED